MFSMHHFRSLRAEGGLDHRGRATAVRMGVERGAGMGPVRERWGKEWRREGMGGRRASWKGRRGVGFKFGGGNDVEMGSREMSMVRVGQPSIPW